MARIMSPIKTITLLITICFVLQSCVFVVPVGRQYYYHSKLGRSAIPARQCKKMVAQSLSLTDIIMNVGTPALIDHETRTVIYHSQQIYQKGIEYILIVFITGGPISYTYNNFYSDIFYELKFDEEWKLLGLRQYSIDRPKDILFSDEIYTFRSPLLVDHFMDYQYQSTPDSTAIWPAINPQKPDWIKYKHRDDSHAQSLSYYITDPLNPSEEFLALPDTPTDYSTENAKKRKSDRLHGRHHNK